ncbi:MAG: hybrid sensor histidine kinase/response regulator [Verrucomicrobia bacterium CG_4_10_14_3_um_filter_43_23]|nr:MAG: hypothetical protein AUJ82_04350 [Verrucomicrobia bacterium CG1_02_43_26]PIP59070.1 MAG: hybrid sensor histidine kinase/response regulator [Verrucomicrobia bacterium CG22_combo_CG10-13_8_21_14_all_43_17]PIX59167.1 MAG: hybrid sensor histidine kinase/response regulator [Verrucomicrobia bacterium CG_4_10_14_3_um_filter_43_23]PIY61308.1 MAG: hybrid sensor histidine kinase/response regulator [Verrucomicrobia bacterium CG_4_10_14_0_8_um_filter_43_34]PJA44090.1 MAG: hybrid sensor histidine ki
MKKLLRENGEPPLILIVDDYKENLSVLGKNLEEAGYDIMLANSGKQAISLVKEVIPDLILLDIMMPELNGLEVCVKLKSNEDYAGIPIIFLTAKVDSDDILKGFKAGGVDYITKPFNTMELLARVQNHLELKFSNEKLQMLNDSKDRFFSIISHDIKGSLSGMMLLQEMTLNHFDEISPIKIKDNLAVIAKSSRRLYQMLENLLDWATLQRGLIQLNPSILCIHDLAQQSIELFEGKCIHKKLTIHNNIDKTLNVFADYDIVISVFRNLISNATKFSHPGGSIEIESKENGPLAEISVIDHGVGMKDNDKKSLFHMSKNRSKEGTNFEKGSGLGLLLCHELITKCAGKISVESEIGQGSTFTISLPLVKREEKTTPQTDTKLIIQ